MLDRLRKLVGIAGAGAAILWFGVAWGPQSVHAEIYREVVARVTGAVEAIADRIRPGPDRYFVMNGNVVRAQLGQSDLLPDEFIDELAAGFPTQIPMLPAGRMSHEDELRLLSHALRAPRRVNGPGWSALVQIFGGEPGAAEDVSRRFRKSGALGPEAAGGFLVLATRGDRGSLTDVWLLHFDEDFKPLDYTAAFKGSGDVKGGDIPGVDRYPGSQRTLTLSEVSPMGEVHNVTYLGAGTIEDHAAHYRRVFEKLELAEAPTTRGARGETMLRFRDAEREVTVFIDRAPVADGIQDLIQISTYR